METDLRFEKIFTVAEAERTLPLVQRIVADILAAGAELKQNAASAVAESEHDTGQQQLEELILELQEMGCFYKDWDFERGLVDFPAVIGGELVFLCWRSDEPSVRFFHRIEEGYAGRRSLPASQNAASSGGSVRRPSTDEPDP
jgi:hypothetical protein